MTIYSVDDLKNHEKILALTKGAIIELDSDLVFTTELLDRLDEFIFKKKE